MKNIILPMLLVLIFSCGQNNNSPGKVAHTDTIEPKTQEEKVFDYPVLFRNWQMGDHNNTRVVLQMYKAWDEGSIEQMRSLFDDSVILNLPDGRRFADGREEMVSDLLQARNKYKSAKNEILSAVPLNNTDNNEDWVHVLVYNKWTYKNNTRDSMLYQDLWRIRNGKINSLLSLEQTLSRVGTEKLEKLIQSK